MAVIEYYYTLLSPFTYLAGMQLEEIAATHDAEIVYCPTDIAAVLGLTGGLAVKDRHPVRQEYRLQELKRLSQLNELLITLHPRHWPVDPVPASCAVLAAIAQGGDGGAISHAFLRACWAEERDISDPETVGKVLVENGFSVPNLRDSLEAAAAEYAANTERALSQGVFGAPFYIVDGERFWGQDRLNHLDWHLEQLRGAES